MRRNLAMRFAAILAGSAGLLAVGTGAEPADATAGPGASVVSLAGAGTATNTASGALAGHTGLNDPQAVAVDALGDVVVAVTNSCEIDMLPAHPGRQFGVTMTAGHIYVVAGRGCAALGPPTRSVDFPSGVAVGKDGDLVVVSASSNTVVAINHRSGRITDLAGTGHIGVPRSGSLAIASSLNHPEGVAADQNGDVFIADSGNCQVDMVPAQDGTFFGQAMLAGHLYPVAGTGTCGISTPGGPARSAAISAPIAVAVDVEGDLFITESGIDDIVEVPVSTGTYFGVTIAADDIAPIVGSGSNNTFLADGLPATSSFAELNYPDGIAVDGTGDLFIADGLDRSIREVPAHNTTLFGRTVTSGAMYTAAGASIVSARGVPGDGTTWIGAQLVDPTGVAVDGSDLVIADAGANRIWRLS
jgi:trimeric autotransporter adhesin